LAAEAELGTLYLNAKEAAYLRQIVTKMGHLQPRTPIQTNNLTAEGVINHKIQPKQTKAMDMRFHWLCNRDTQGQFQIYWQQGKLNIANYFTKHHTPCIAPCQCQVKIPVQGQRISRSKMSETGTRKDHTQISNKQISCKGVLDLPNMYVCREATYLAK
jgi:hypothetical protein